jgi:hypothetical protein
MAMMAITTNSSIKVNAALCLFVQRLAATSSNWSEGTRLCRSCAMREQAEAVSKLGVAAVIFKKWLMVQSIMPVHQTDKTFLLFPPAGVSQWY